MPPQQPLCPPQCPCPFPLCPFIPSLYPFPCARAPGAGGGGHGKGRPPPGVSKRKEDAPGKVPAVHPTGLREGGFPPFLWGRGGQPRPNVHGLGGGRLRGCPGIGGGGMRPPGYSPRARRIRHAHQPPLLGLLDQGGGRFRPGMGLPERGCPVGEPPVQPPRGGGDEGITGRLPDAARRPEWEHGPSAGPTLENMGLPPGLQPPAAVGPGRTPARRSICRGPDSPPPPPDPGAQLMAAHRHTHTLPLRSRPGKVERSGTCNASTPQAHSEAPPPHDRPPGPALPRWGPPPRLAGPSSSRGRRRNQVRMPQHRRNLPLHRRVPPHGTPRWRRRRPIRDRHTGTCMEIQGMPRGPPPGAPMETDPEPLHDDTRVDEREALPAATGPMEMDEPSPEGQARLPS